MKTTNETKTSELNLVMFPSAKNFPEREKVSDPLFDLIHEYDHLTLSDFPSFEDERFDNDLIDLAEDQLGYESLEAFMNRHKMDLKREQDQVLKSLENNQNESKITELVDLILEAQSRINFYLDEIENCLPQSFNLE